MIEPTIAKRYDGTNAYSSGGRTREQYNVLSDVDSLNSFDVRTTKPSVLKPLQ